MMIMGIAYSSTISFTEMGGIVVVKEHRTRMIYKLTPLGSKLFKAIPYAAEKDLTEIVALDIGPSADSQGFVGDFICELKERGILTEG